MQTRLLVFWILTEIGWHCPFKRHNENMAETNISTTETLSKTNDKYLQTYNEA